MPIFRWIYPKIMGKGQFFGALRAHKMLILLNFAQKSLSCPPPPPPGHSEEYSPMVAPISISQHAGCRINKFSAGRTKCRSPMWIMT